MTTQKRDRLNSSRDGSTSIFIEELGWTRMGRHRLVLVVNAACIQSSLCSAGAIGAVLAQIQGRFSSPATLEHVECIDLSAITHGVT